MKVTQKGFFRDFFSIVIWILMTIFSILKSAITFIAQLFFYNNVSLTSDELNDEIPNLDKNEDKSQNQLFDNLHNSSSKFDKYLDHSISEKEINSADLSTEKETDSNEEMQINEEEEREKLKEELEKEDEEEELHNDQINLENYSNFDNKGFSPVHPIKEPSLLVPKETERENKQPSDINESVVVNKNVSDEDESDSDTEFNEESKSEIQNPQTNNNEDEKDNLKELRPIKRQFSNVSEKHHDSRAHSLKNDIKKVSKTFSPELLEKRRSAINKLIDSEEEYRRYLNIILDIYRAKVNGFIDKETNDLIFGHIKALIVLSEEFSSIFYDELKKGPGEAEISKCFTNFQQAVNVFTPFMLNCKKSISTYKKLLTTNIRFTIIIKKIELTNSNLKFINIYTLPTRQFSNYINLLKEILKETPQWHIDYQEIPKVIILLRETDQKIEKLCKDNANEAKLRSLQHQIINCPTLESSGRRYIRSFNLLDWKKLYIFSDMLLLTRRRRLRKEIDFENVRSIWLDSNTGTIHLKILNKKNARIRGGIKGNEIYTILKTQINQKSSDGKSSPPPQTSSHEKFLYRRSDLVRPLPPSGLSSFDESSINTEVDSNSFANSYFSTSTNETNPPQKSVFIYPKDDNKINNADTENSDDDDDTYSDSDNNFSEIPDVTGNLEDSESDQSNHDTNNTDNNSQSATTAESQSTSDENDKRKFSEQMLHDRKVAIDNLAASEQRYQQNLESIVNLYKSKFSKSIENEKTEQAVFGNVSSLIVLSEQTNLTLKNEIEKGIEKAEIWKCYSLTPQYIKYYHTYITSYTSMLSHYNDFVISDKKIKKFVKKIEENDPQHRFTVLSIMPFVRINTLIKQLQSILSSTPDWHTDYINLPDTISALSSISSDSAKMCTQAENLNQLIQIETSISDCPSLFSENRTFLRSFVLNDKTTIYVLNDIIVFARPNKKIKYCLNFSEIMKISNKLTTVSLTMNDGKTHSIKSSDQTQKIYDFLKEQKARQAVSV